MNDFETAIFNHLKNHPDLAYITADGMKLYALAPDEDGLVSVEGDFRLMDADQVNDYIKKLFS